MKLETFKANIDGHTDIEYLDVHFHRFLATQKLTYRDWKWDKADILDIGAHWLHQSLLFALDGHRVIAADFSHLISDPDIQALASRQGIELLGYENLSSESVFDELPDESIDVVLFSEILEHITFNPVGMWKAIYRVLRPGGRIVVTTPNFYRKENFKSTLKRFLTGMGNGITITDVLNRKTHAPHWKEYSMKEIRQYFGLLSPDFQVHREEYVDFELEGLDLNWKGTLVYRTSKIIPLFREGLFTSIELREKSAGISIEPCW